MKKIKFDFEATKERIYAPNSNVPIGAPVDRNGNIANDGNAYGIVLCKETENEKYWVKYNLVVMVAGYCDIIDAQAIWGDEYSAGAKAAMSNITFCDNHELPTGGGGGGMMVVHFAFIEDYVTADKTPADVVEAVLNGGYVVGLIDFGEGGVEPLGGVMFDVNYKPCFVCNYINDDLNPHYNIYTDGDNWVYED